MEQAIQTNEVKPQKKPKKRLKKRWYVLIALLIAIVVLFVYFSNAAAKAVGNLLAFDDTTTLAYMDLQHIISATGTVVSANARNVYSTQTYTVEEIPVEVGDKVAAGDTLCVLDGSSIQTQIEKTELSMEASKKSSAQQVKTAKDNYNATKEALENDTNASLLSARNTLDNALASYEKAQDTLAQYKKTQSLGHNTSILQAENSERDAKKTLDAARDALSLLVDLETAAPGSVAAADMEKAETTLAKAQDAYLLAVTQLSAQERGVNLTQQDYEKAVETAYTAYVAAQKSLEAAEASAQTQLKSSENSLKTSQIAANTDVTEFELSQLYKNLEDTTITAPISGTVTAIYATVGASGSGLLFVIEDTENLVVETSVKEYDIGTVTPGLAVSIKSDATGDAQYEGRIASIAPTSKKLSTGATDTSGDILFETEVDVLSKNSPLRIGMSVRLNYIVEQKQNVLAAPYEAVYTNARGQTCILTIARQESGNYLISEVPVTTGMESDLYIEISAETDLADQRVINSPAGYTMLIGQEIPVTEHRVYNGNGFSMPGMGMAVRAG